MAARRLQWGIVGAWLVSVLLYTGFWGRERRGCPDGGCEWIVLPWFGPIVLFGLVSLIMVLKDGDRLPMWCRLLGVLGYWPLAIHFVVRMQ